MAVIDGTDLRIYINGNPIGHATSCTLDLSKEIRETVSKDNIGGWAEKEGGQKSATLQFEGFYTLDANLGGVAVSGADDLFDAFDGDAVIAWKFSDEVSGNIEYSGNAIMSSLSFGAPVNENATHSGSLEVTGAVAKATIA